MLDIHVVNMVISLALILVTSGQWAHFVLKLLLRYMTS